MVIIGLVLFLAAGIFGLDVADKNRFRIRDIQAFGESLGVSGSGRLYVIGAITGAALVLGLFLMLAGVRRKGSKALDRRHERKAAGEQESELEKLKTQNIELRDRLDSLEADRSDRVATPQTVGADAPHSGTDALDN